MTEQQSPETRQDSSDAGQSLQKAVLQSSANAEQSTSEDAKDYDLLKPRRVEPRSSDDSVLEYVVWPKNGNDMAAVSKTEGFLKDLTQQSSIFSYSDSDGDLIVWAVNVTDSQVKAIQGNEGVASIDRNLVIGEKDAAVPVPTEPAKISDAARVKRDIQYTAQSMAGYELKMISQPQTVPDLDDLENYVYEVNGGSGIYIYHVEEGVQLRKADEFPTDRIDYVLQTQYSISKGQARQKDSSSDGHSTQTASKAMGVKYGSAKKSKLVVVKMADLSRLEISKVFDYVWSHIDQNQRRGKAVVTASWGTLDTSDPNNPDPSLAMMQKSIKRLLDNDIPVCVSAGNAAQKTNNGQLRTDADKKPAVFEGPDYPIIVVGNVDSTGIPEVHLQRGSHVQVWAPGTDVDSQDPDQNDPKSVTGTSFSAPLMAGMLATYLGSASVPFDTSSGKLVSAAKQYLIDHANWPRQPDIKVLWNEVDEAHNPKKADTGPAIISLASTGSAPAPTVTTSGPPPLAAPYAQGVCGFHLTQSTVVGNPNGEYDLEVLMTDNNNAQIGYTDRTQADATSPLHFQSKLEDVLTCVPESQNDYIAFALGAQQWSSNGNFAQGAVPSCSVGGWDGDVLRVRNMDCVFQCTWGGGKSSDGTN